MKKKDRVQIVAKDGEFISVNINHHKSIDGSMSVSVYIFNKEREITKSYEFNCR